MIGLHRINKQDSSHSEKGNDDRIRSPLRLTSTLRLALVCLMLSVISCSLAVIVVSDVFLITSLVSWIKLASTSIPSEQTLGSFTVVIFKPFLVNFYFHFQSHFRKMNFRMRSRMTWKWSFLKNRTIQMLLQKWSFFAQFYFPFSGPVFKLRPNQCWTFSHSNLSTFSHSDLSTVYYGT
jgi:hypothetical protein